MLKRKQFFSVNAARGEASKTPSFARQVSFFWSWWVAFTPAQASIMGVCECVCEREWLGACEWLTAGGMCGCASRCLWISAANVFFSPRVPGPSLPSCPHTPTLLPSPFHLHSLYLVNTHARTRARTHLTATNCVWTHRGFPLGLYHQSCIELFHLFLGGDKFNFKDSKALKLFIFL